MDKSLFWGESTHSCLIKQVHECSSLTNDFSAKMGSRLRKRLNNGEHCEELIMLRATGDREVWKMHPKILEDLLFLEGARRVQRFSTTTPAPPPNPGGAWEIILISELHILNTFPNKIKYFRRRNKTSCKTIKLVLTLF